jgi:hypothetical protein
MHGFPDGIAQISAIFALRKAQNIENVSLFTVSQKRSQKKRWRVRTP